MVEASSAPRRDPRVLAAILVVLLLAFGGFALHRIAGLSDRVGVILESEAGSILLAGEETATEWLQFVVGPGDSRLVFVPAATPAGEGWDGIVAALVPGGRLVSVERPTETRRSSADGDERREVIALRARLVIEDAAGRRRPALGIGAGVTSASEAASVIARTIVEVAGPGGEPVAVDAEPLYDDGAGILERLRGVPGHVVLFSLERIEEPRDDAPPGDGAGGGAEVLPDDETLRAIDRLRREKPERGVIPATGGAADDGADPAPGDG